MFDPHGSCDLVLSDMHRQQLLGCGCKLQTHYRLPKQLALPLTELTCAEGRAQSGEEGMRVDPVERRVVLIARGGLLGG